MGEDVTVQAMRRLADGLARKATIAPGGTKWPGWTAPDAPFVAVIGFEGANVCGCGDTVEQARADLVFELLAIAQSQDPAEVEASGQDFTAATRLEREAITLARSIPDDELRDRLVEAARADGTDAVLVPGEENG